MLDHIFQGLASPSRRRILSLLGAGELSAGRIATAFECSRPAVSQHLAVLLAAELLDCRSEGRQRLYSVSPRAMNDLREYMEAFWSHSLLRLKMAAEAEARQLEGLAPEPPRASSSQNPAFSGSPRARSTNGAARTKRKEE